MEETSRYRKKLGLFNTAGAKIGGCQGAMKILVGGFSLPEDINKAKIWLLLSISAAITVVHITIISYLGLPSCFPTGLLASTPASIHRAKTSFSVCLLLYLCVCLM